MTPEEIKEKYGNFKHIKPTRQEALMRLTLQQERQYEQLFGKTDTKSTSRSPGGSTERKLTNQQLASIAFNSKAPYEQHLVTQLIDAYRAPH